MAEQRPYWKGYLKLSLVTCPVAMTPATTGSEKVRFHTMNRDTGNRVVSQYIDSATGKPVKQKNEARGYERGEDDYIILTDEDLEGVELDTVRTIDIEKFVPRDSIDWIYLETPHYLTANGKIGGEAFAVILKAMQAEDVVGISRLVLGRRERAIVLEPRGEGIVVWALRFGDEVRPESEYFEGIDAASNEKAVSALATVIKKRMKDWSPEMAADPIQESLLKLIARKKKANKTSRAKTSKSAGKSAEKSNVIDIMDALKKSVAKELKSRKAG
ncbi:DNA end-binding protein Ku [Rhizobium sp. RU20A]|uniref:non-homologous end joining protein Ku n=1 Tax=Rhizobium sp. RU20A TaxID=1907412 RepID=UPI000955953D|nr:Ku protein [Rhizobium sp. RU20A]SIQ86316.1 DNA end-binding protein Ku [Rhizobium sp. RU20A]